MIGKLTRPHPGPLSQEREKNWPRSLHGSISCRSHPSNETPDAKDAECSIRDSETVAARSLSMREKAGVRAGIYSLSCQSGGQR